MADAAREADEEGCVSRPGDPENNGLYSVLLSSKQAPLPAPEFKCEVFLCRKRSPRNLGARAVSGVCLRHLVPLGILNGGRMFPPGYGPRGQPRTHPASSVTWAAASLSPLYATDEFRCGA